LVVFGGGPETELLGIAKYYLDRAEGGKHAQVEIRIDSIDRVSEWIENVSWIKAEIAKAYTASSMTTSRSDYRATTS